MTYDDKSNAKQLAAILKKAIENDTDTGPMLHVEELNFDEITCEETLALLDVLKQQLKGTSNDDDTTK